MYICIYTYMCVCVCLCLHVCVCDRSNVTLLYCNRNICIYAHLYLYVYMYICIYTCVCVCVCLCLHVCVCDRSNVTLLYRNFSGVFIVCATGRDCTLKLRTISISRLMFLGGRDSHTRFGYGGPIGWFTTGLKRETISISRLMFLGGRDSHARFGDGGMTGWCTIRGRLTSKPFQTHTHLWMDRYTYIDI